MALTQKETDSRINNQNWPVVKNSIHTYANWEDAPTPLVHPPSWQELVDKYNGVDLGIIGNGPSACYADFSEFDKPLWTFNGGWTLHPKSELEFIMDDMKGPALGDHGPDDYWATYQRNTHCPIPILTSTVYPEFPAVIKYPLIEILRYFDMHEPYFGESANYAMAFAIMCGVKSIEFHGVDFINSRPSERASLEFWMGVAKGKGIKLIMSGYSHCLRSNELDGVNCHVPELYGYLPHNVKVPYTELPNGSIYIDW